MASRRWNRTALIALAAMAGWVAHYGAAAPPSTPPVIGLAQNTPAIYALTNVRIVPEPGKVIEKGTIVIRDGVIEAAGAEVKTPADARVVDLAGRTAYAGLIDAYGEITVGPDVTKQGAAGWNPQVTPQIDVAEHYTADEALNSKLRSQGITVRRVMTDNRPQRGRSVSAGACTGRRTRGVGYRSHLFRQAWQALGLRHRWRST
jgi:hypothetical protein